MAARPATFARVTILDVGQGDAILVEGSRGGRLLIDGGPDPDRLLVALDRRIPPWDRRIDAVDPHPPARGPRRRPGAAARALPGAAGSSSRACAGRGPATPPGCATGRARLAPVRLGLAAGDRLTVDEIDLRVLWPIRGRVPREPPDGGTGINNVSVVLLGDGRRPAIPADGRRRGGRSIRRCSAEGLPRVDLLKVAHHGSRTATTAGLRRRGPADGRDRVGREPATRTVIRPGRRWSAWPRPAPACSGPTATARSSSAFEPGGDDRPGRGRRRAVRGLDDSRAADRRTLGGVPVRDPRHRARPRTRAVPAPAVAPSRSDGETRRSSGRSPGRRVPSGR